MKTHLQDKVHRYMDISLSNGLGSSWEERASFLLGPAFNQGETLYFMTAKDEVVGSVGVVLVEALQKGIVYITELRAKSKVEMNTLVTYALEIAKKSGASSIYLGIRNENHQLLSWVDNAHFEDSHDMIQLVNHVPQVCETTNTIHALDKKDASLYASITSDAFRDVPNGASLTTSEVNDMLDRGVDIGFSYDGTVVTGVYEVSMKDDVGWIDVIAIDTVKQGFGYGKNLLRALINKHLGQNAKTIRMLVADKNKKAYAMYIAHGFVEEKIFSSWFKYTNKGMI